MSSCCLPDSACNCTCTCGKYKFINLTGSVIRIFDPKLMKVINADYAYLDIGFDPKVFNKMATLNIKPDTSTTFYDKNVKMTSKMEGDLGCCSTFMMYTYRYQGTSILPDYQEDTLLIVPDAVLASYPYRRDLVAPYKPVKCYDSPDDAVIGYCGFYKNYDGIDTSEDVNNTVIMNYNDNLYIPRDVKNPVSISFAESISSTGVYEVICTPVDCQIYDESGEVGVITSSGTTYTVSGTVEELNEIFKHFYVEPQAENCSVKFDYANKSTYMNITSYAVTVDWEDITNKPKVVTYDDTTEDGDGLGLELPDGSQVDIFEVELPPAE